MTFSILSISDSSPSSATTDDHPTEREQPADGSNLEILRQADLEAQQFADGLQEIARIVRQDVGLDAVGNDLGKRAEALRSSRFRVVVVGDFSRGKSTLLNALLGRDLLPQKVTPATAIITEIEYGDTPQVRIQYTDDRDDLILTPEAFKKDFVLSDEDQPADAKDHDRFTHIHHATVSYPLELCRHRVDLVDSPGLQDSKTRTERTLGYLKEADAVIMVLDATALLKENEVHFLENVLRPLGFQNIFFAVNKWNLVAASVLRPEDVDEEFAQLDSRLRERLQPFCVVDGVDRSGERIFRLDALGAVKARLQTPRDRQQDVATGVPAFEDALGRFLVFDRGRARRGVVVAALQSTEEQVDRYIETQLQLAGRSIAEIEAEIDAVQPKLERLRGIQQHIESYLRTQSSNLQDRLAISFRTHMERLAAQLPEKVKAFDLTPLTEGLMVWKAVTDWARDDENKLKAKVQRHLEPQIQELLEREISRWQESVVQNELRSVTLDVEKYLQEEAAEYRRVLKEIEDQLGIEGQDIDIDRLVHGWLTKGADEVSLAAGSISLGVLGDVSWLVAGIVSDIILDATINAALGIATGIGAIIALGRMIWREATIRDELRERLTEALTEKLKELEASRTGRIRRRVREEFDALSERIVGNIEDEITLIDAGLQAILERKQRAEFSAETERRRLQAARRKITVISRRLLGGSPVPDDAEFDADSDADSNADSDSDRPDDADTDAVHRPGDGSAEAVGADPSPGDDPTVRRFVIKGLSSD